MVRLSSVHLALRIAGCVLLVPWLWAAQSTTADGRALDTPPRVVKKAELEYPTSISSRYGAIFGEVTIQFIVNEKGEPVDLKVTKATHPAFVPPAIKALFHTKFEPGILNGKPEASRFSYSFSFIGRSPEGYIGVVDTQGPFRFPAKSGPNAEERFRYDRAPRTVAICEPVYPLNLLLENARGTAESVFIISPIGSVAAERTKGARPEFAAALRAALQTWRFTPPQLENRATMAKVSWQQKFEGEDSLDAEAARVLKLLRKNPEKIVEASSLDHKPRPLYQVPPLYPLELEGPVLKGGADIEFIIDREGRARLPNILAADREEFGWSAATAVQQWFYEVPVSKGKPVDVRVRMHFNFAPAQ